MESNHHMITGDASDMAAVDDASIDLVVTSPPYPMITMWDDLFSAADPTIEKCLKKCDARKAFDQMHNILDAIWKEVRRVIKPGGLVCINIGDATRTIDGHFQLFANHARIITAFLRLGFTQLPAILWRKPTNAPNKFMGSGMLPAGAYVTLEHEYILIFRLHEKRAFETASEKINRNQSAYFWEERNIWFSDVWFDLRGTTQRLIDSAGMRSRSGAFPLMLPYRLINMYSVKGDTILDPFIGTGTTMLAAMCSGRNCVGYELEHGFQSNLLQQLADVPSLSNRIIEARLKDHVAFVEERLKAKKDIKYRNRHYHFPVMTRQEVDLRLDPVRHLQYVDSTHFKVLHADPIAPETPHGASGLSTEEAPWSRIVVRKGRQLKLF